jgi:hypothetical protein
VFENDVLKRIFESNLTGKRRKLHNLYSFPNIRQLKSRRMVGEACGMHGGGEKNVQDFGGKARKKTALGRPRRT